MKELIAVNQSKIGGGWINTVNARDLHSFLGVGKDFSNWIKKQIERARLAEGRDFLTVAQKGVGGTIGVGGRVAPIEYYLTLEAGKHIAMLSGTEKGFEVREYFIECERVANKPQQTFHLPDFTNPAAAAIAWAEQWKEKESLRLTIIEQAPKIEFCDKLASAQAISVDYFVKSISGKAGIIIGRNNFYAWMRKEKLVNQRNLPFQEFIDAGWFEVRESTYENVGSNGPRACFTTLITGRGQAALFDRLKKSLFLAEFVNKAARLKIINLNLPEARV